jgi:hypothetical protein
MGESNERIEMKRASAAFNRMNGAKYAVYRFLVSAATFQELKTTLKFSELLVALLKKYVQDIFVHVLRRLEGVRLAAREPDRMWSAPFAARFDPSRN